MKLVYDAEVDAAYLYIAGEQPVVAKTVTATGEINLDFDAEGKLVGVEVAHASKLLPKEALKDRI